jgi:hypothetical protein
MVLLIHHGVPICEEYSVRERRRGSSVSAYCLSRVSGTAYLGRNSLQSAV